MSRTLYHAAVHALALWGLLDVVARLLPDGWPL
jgi:hypothetical protein